jgi:hypothetical protein
MLMCFADVTLLVNNNVARLLEASLKTGSRSSSRNVELFCFCAAAAQHGPRRPHC